MCSLLLSCRSPLLQSISLSLVYFSLYQYSCQQTVQLAAQMGAPRRVLLDYTMERYRGQENQLYWYNRHEKCQLARIAEKISPLSSLYVLCGLLCVSK